MLPYVLNSVQISHDVISETEDMKFDEQSLDPHSYCSYSVAPCSADSATYSAIQTTN
jgi:uncharacterized OsmC-like protein